MRVRAKFFTLLLFAAAARAQDPAVLTAPPDTDTIASYLHSEDQRLIAWGATFTLQTKDTALLRDLMLLAEDWRPVQPYAADAPQLDQSSLDRKSAMQLVLDTLIQMNVTPPAGSLENLANDFPMQTAILLSRLSTVEAEQTLHDFYFDPGYSSFVLKRVSADMLAQQPPAGFAASLLNGMTVRVTVLITSPGQPPFGIGYSSGSCFGQKQPTPLPGWPTLYQYDLHQSFNENQGDFPVITAPDLISARREPGPQTSPNCGSPGLVDDHRQKLIAQMLGAPSDKLGWRASDSTFLRITSVADYNMLLSRFAASYMDRLRATNLALQQKGLLTAEEAATALPHVHFWIDDRRPDRSTVLPIPTSPDNNIVYEKSPWNL